MGLLWENMLFMIYDVGKFGLKVVVECILIFKVYYLLFCVVIDVMCEMDYDGYVDD